MTLTDRLSEGCGLFEFDITTPLFEQISRAFDTLSPVDLSAENLATVLERPGVYGLHHGRELVYVGKANNDARGRLRKYQRQLQGRIGITPAEVQFRCLHLAHTWDPFQPEAHMISRHKPSWNYTGFGPNDPGRERDRTNLKDTHWHVRFPLDPDYVCADVVSGQYDVLELLRAVAKSAPYWVRFQGNREGRNDKGRAEYEAAHKDFGAARVVTVPADNMTARELLLLAIKAFPNPSSWQLTQLPSHLLLYREIAATYPRMKRLWP